MTCCKETQVYFSSAISVRVMTESCSQIHAVLNLLLGEKAAFAGDRTFEWVQPTLQWLLRGSEQPVECVSL